MSLQVRQLVKHFGGVQAVKGLSFELQVGECVALIGPNGAGKSTSFACIAGQHRLTGGEVLWAGERIDDLSPAQRLARGVARTFQVAQTFEALTVLQNVQLLLQAPLGLTARHVLDRQQVARAQALLAQVGLQDLAHSQVGGLAYGAKKRLELALALAGVAGSDRVPRLLLLDEPAAGLAGPERARLMALVKSLAQPVSSSSAAADATTAGLAVLYTEHNMDAVFGVADRVLVLIDGQLAAHGTPGEIALNETVRRRYLGHAGSNASGAEAPRVSVTPPAALMLSEPAVLQVQQLNVWYGAAQALFDVSLKLVPGELVVLQGLNGAGKSTLLQALMGLSLRMTGQVIYDNKSLFGQAPHQRARQGLGYVAEDRRLFGALSVQENLRVAARGEVLQHEERVLSLFPVLKTMLRRPAAQMSGGEQQMLALARTLMGAPRLLLLDEPCEGIAPVLVETMVAALLQLRAEGMPMLVAEQNKLLSERADRVLTLVAGQLPR
jgi:branched-chain amino acid transport system ATP-binding protein